MNGRDAAQALLARPENTSVSLMKLIERAAFQPDFDVAKLQAMLDMKLKYEANEARLAYIASFQKFKENPPDINKTKKVSYVNKDKSVTEYWHAELDDVVDVIGKALKAVGIIHNWRTSDNGGKIVVTCVLTHEQGHSEEVATLAGPADVSGGKNNIQAIGSTSSYLQRYTLLAGTGLAAKGQDNDGRTEGMPANGIEDYCTQMRDSRTVEAVFEVFKKCYAIAKQLGDTNAMGQFINVYEERKKALRR